jgi:hypothetical protein
MEGQVFGWLGNTDIEDKCLKVVSLIVEHLSKQEYIVVAVRKFV